MSAAKYNKRTYSLYVAFTFKVNFSGTWNVCVCVETVHAYTLNLCIQTISHFIMYFVIIRYQ